MSHDHTHASGPPVRASDTERDHAGGVLRAGYAEGRLSRDELDERLAAAYSARTRADLAGLTSDLPGAVTAEAAPGRAAPGTLPVLIPETGTGSGLGLCLLLCLLCAFPPAGIAYGIYWIVAARRQPQQTVPESPLPGARTIR